MAEEYIADDFEQIEDAAFAKYLFNNLQTSFQSHHQSFRDSRLRQIFTIVSTDMRTSSLARVSVLTAVVLDILLGESI